MKVIIYFLFSIFSFCVFLKSEHTIFAKQQEKHKSFEEGFFEIGYKSLKEAHEDFEGHFNQELKLPLKVPPVEFTHYFGRFSDLDEEINDSFDVEFISETSPENHYKIDVRPIKYKIPIENKSVVKIFKLQNGNDAWYTETSGFNVLVFEGDNWQYMLSIDKSVSDKVTPETLVQIANSIEYPEVQLLK